MSKKAKFNAEGFPVAFYDTEINKVVPSDAVFITDEQWKEFLDNAGKRRWDGEKVVEYTAPFNADQCANAIKAIAGQVIISIAPEYKQRNMLAVSVEVADAKAQGTATAEQIAQSEAIRAVWAKITAVRAKSDELETQYIELGKDLTAADLASIKTELETAGELT